MGVPIEFNELDSGPKERGRLFCFSGSLAGRAVSSSLAARTNDEMNFSALLRFLRDYPTASELQVIRVRSKR
jgi:hypothetical protein